MKRFKIHLGLFLVLLKFLFWPSGRNLVSRQVLCDSVGV